MERRFGDEYRAYMREVPRWLPRLSARSRLRRARASGSGWVSGHHVAGALDQRVPRLGTWAPDDPADCVVDGRKGPLIPRRRGPGR